MKTKTLRAFFILPLMALLSCGPSKDVLNSTGDLARVETNTNSRYTGELLFIQDTLVYLLVEGTGTKGMGTPEKGVYCISTSTLRSIEIDGYANRKWQASMLAFQIVPTVLLMISAGSVNSGNVGGAFLLFGLPTILTYLLFEAGTPEPPGAKAPLSESALDELRKYARFPQGLTSSQLTTLLEIHGQTEVRQLK